MKDTKQQLKELFETLCQKVQSQNQQSGKQYFAHRGDQESASYFEEPGNSGKEYFSFFENRTQEDLANEFKSLWSTLGNEELIEFSDQLAKIAFALQEENQSQAQELSDFVYVMY